MKRYPPVASCDWEDEDEPARSVVEEVDRYDNSRSPTGLFVITGGLEVGLPNITTDQSFGHSTHGSFSRPSISVPSMLWISA